MSGDARPRTFTRRRVLALSAAALPAGRSAAHDRLGPLNPRQPAPPLALTRHDGQRRTLAQLLQGRTTALQLMFTGCSNVCPIQGAVFAGVQARLERRSPRQQLLSISIDALGDDAVALDAWRRRFNAGPRWIAAVPAIAQAEVLPRFLDDRAASRAANDPHSTQVFLFDALGRLAYRLADLASAGAIADALDTLDRQG